MKEQKVPSGTTVDAISAAWIASQTGLKAAESLQGGKSPSEYVERKLPPATLTVIGFDVEWVLREDRRSNCVLSYQWAVKTHAGECEGIYYVAKEAGGDGKRLKFHQLLSLAIQDARAKGLLTEWPKSVYATAHWTRADLSHLADFSEIKTKFNAVRKTYASTFCQYNTTCWDRSRHSHKLSVILADTMLLTPASGPLEMLGKAHGFPKEVLPEGCTKGLMDLFLWDHPAEFERYAIRDPKICVLHLWSMLRLKDEVLGGGKLPLTLASFALKYLLTLWDRDGFDQHAVLGTKRIKTEYWNERVQRYVTRPKTVLTAGRLRHEDLAKRCYIGGRNEAFIFGITKKGIWIDYDLSKAYTTEMAGIKTPDYERARVSLRPEDYTADVMGFADIHFSFPEGTEYPCIPVDPIGTDHGLICSLEGCASVCSPEIEVARNLGAEIKILHGVIVPWADERHPFEEFARETQRRRGNDKTSFNNLVWKEIGNALYGKTAQGLTPKSAFDPRSGESKLLGPSEITNPYFSAYTTSRVRAHAAELMNGIPSHRTLVSFTTDGFISDAWLSEIDQSGPLASRFAELRERLSNDPKILEVKSKVARVLCYKTRGQITVEKIGKEFPLAKAGTQTPKGLDKDGQNRWMLEKFMSREPGTEVDRNSLISMREMYAEDADMIPVNRKCRLNMDPDWKRELISPTTRFGHLFCETRPWPKVDDFLENRRLFDEWRRNNVLKTMEDWECWIAYRDGTKASRAGVQRTKGGVVDQAYRIVLRALVRGLWGLPGGDYKAVAEWFTGAGFPTTEDALKDAKRRGALVEHAIPLDAPGVTDLIRTILSRFPGFEWQRLVEGGGRGLTKKPHARAA